MLTATACGAPWLVRRGGHIAIDSFVRQLPRRAHAVVSRLTIAFSAVVSGFLAWRAAALAAEVAARGDVDIRSIDVPAWVAPALLALALGLCAAEFVRLLVTGERPAGGHGAGA
jgi:TRAP-type C4-dicarboxylate transport system permease small subunit